MKVIKSYKSHVYWGHNVAIGNAEAGCCIFCHFLSPFHYNTVTFVHSQCDFQLIFVRWLFYFHFSIWRLNSTCRRMPADAFSFLWPAQRGMDLPELHTKYDAICVMIRIKKTLFQSKMA